jgi:hypothetical protein
MPDASVLSWCNAVADGPMRGQAGAVRFGSVRCGLVRCCTSLLSIVRLPRRSSRLLCFVDLPLVRRAVAFVGFPVPFVGLPSSLLQLLLALAQQSLPLVNVDVALVGLVFAPVQPLFTGGAVVAHLGVLGDSTVARLGVDFALVGKRLSPLDARFPVSHD